jgi:putative endonuclease
LPTAPGIRRTAPYGLPKGVPIPAMPNRRREGDRFEDLACAYLRRKGYKILDRNVYLMRKELDVVAELDGTVVFVEVKGRRSKRFGAPVEAMGRTKTRRVVAAAEAYVKQKGLTGRRCRFDFIAVTFESDRPRIAHIEDAFGT